MNHYEELGIRSDADEEEIRKAHRRLVKLMHPDQHRDQSLKQLAETQMRRLNSIVATLLDPEERREYDEQLRGADTLSAAPQQSAWRSVPWWIASTLGAIVLTVGAVWFFADRIGSHINRSTPPQVEVVAPEKDKTDVPTAPIPDKSATAQPQNPPETTVAKVPVPGPEKKPAVVVTPPQPFPTARTETARARPPVTGLKPPSDGVPTRKFIGHVPEVTVPAPTRDTADASLRPPPAPASATSAGGIDIPRSDEKFPPPPSTPVPATGHRDPLEGEWVYAPTEPQKRKPGWYSPEFIQLKLTKDTNGMHGEYSARYNVADNHPVSPNVNFVLKAVDDKSRRYVWKAADGRHGWFVIRQLEPDTMRLEWRDTSARNGQQALTSGMATLVRKN